MADDQDDIPTLGEIIFPGNPEKVSRQTAPKPTETEQARREKLGEPARTTAPRTSSAQDSRQKPSNFEALISARVDHILEKHMEAARTEIVRMVMLELRARLPGTNNPRN